MKVKSLLFALTASLPLLAILKVGAARAFTFNTGYDGNTSYGGTNPDNNSNTVIPLGSRTNSTVAYNSYLSNIGVTAGNGSTIDESFENINSSKLNNSGNNPGYSTAAANSNGVPIDGLTLSLSHPGTTNVAATNYTATFSYTTKADGSSATDGGQTLVQQANDANGVTNAGTYPTDGVKGISINSRNNFTISLSQDISNFSFWGSDLGDSSNILTVELYDDGNLVGSRAIDYLNNGASDSTNPGDSSVFFFGANADELVPGGAYDPDPDEFFDEIRLVSSANSPDGSGFTSDAIGLDQFTFAVDGIASTSQGEAVPEPLTILGSIAALGFGAKLRKKLRGAEAAE